MYLIDIGIKTRLDYVEACLEEWLWSESTA